MLQDAKRMTVVSREGRLYSQESNAPVIFRDDEPFWICVPASALSDNHISLIHEDQSKVILQQGSILTFEFGYQSDQYVFKTRLCEDLVLTKKVGKSSRLSPCHCEITMIHGPIGAEAQVIMADSLTQAFNKTSVHYRPENRSHTCNVFITFRYHGVKLTSLRCF